jgi:UDP-galactopyranose mutase
MVENMIDHPAIRLMTNTDYFDVRDELQAGVTVFTGELDRFFDYRFGRLEYRSLHLDFRTYDTERFQPAAVVNYPNDYGWTRITEYKYLLDESSPKTTVSYEFPKAEGKPYYVVLTKENLEKRRQYRELAEELEKQGSHFFIGRLAEYSYYNMDEVIASVLDKLRSAQ